jgi:hypothetical protein
MQVQIHDGNDPLEALGDLAQRKPIPGLIVIRGSPALGARGLIEHRFHLDADRHQIRPISSVLEKAHDGVERNADD